jgi:hypothetical protein
VGLLVWACQLVASMLPVMVVVPQLLPASPLDKAETSESPGATKSGLILQNSRACNLTLHVQYYRSAYLLS